MNNYPYFITRLIVSLSTSFIKVFLSFVLFLFDTLPDLWCQTSEFFQIRR
ncbi:hypothetical protein X975_20640, partial [Stegodyphus mimosarum]